MTRRNPHELDQVPIDTRRPEQSEFTSGDPDTGLIDPSHQPPVLLSEEERARGLAAVQAIKSQMGSNEYDGVYPSISAWSHARQEADPITSDDVGFEPKSWRQTVPFEPLRREIGTSPDPDTEIAPMTGDLQHMVMSWVEASDKPFDIVQRAEGLADPSDTYYSAGVRATRNFEAGQKGEVAAKKGEAGRASIYGLYQRTREHGKTAEYRFKKSIIAKKRLVRGWELSEEDRGVIADSIQELGNNIAADMDNNFPGGPKQARITGNSVVAVSTKLLDDEIVDPSDYELLFSATILNLQKQIAMWKAKIEGIEKFSETMGIDLSKAS